jgi:lipoprotein-releasing system permease protein
MTRLPISLFLALRYLRPRRTFVSVITIISVLGVMLGVMVLILVISVMSGFDYELRQKVLGMNPHITVTGYSPIKKWEEITKTIEKNPDVKGASPFIVGPVLAKFQGRVFTPFLKGIHVGREEKLSNVKKFVVQGNYDLSGEKIIVGIELARRYGILVGDKVTIYSPKNFEDKKVAYLPAEPVVTGIFESGMFEYDLGFIFSSLETAQELYDIGGQVHGIGIMTDNLENVDRVKNEVNEILPRPLHASSWMELNKRIFSAIAVEKNMMFFLLIFIIIVAAFGIMSTLITVTVQKTREIGILKSIGATPGMILQIFLWQGIIVGIIGTSLGLILGLTLLEYRNEFLDLMRHWTGFELFPREIYNFDQLPARTNRRDLILICGSAFLICKLAALFPAWRASRMQPARALRDL